MNKITDNLTNIRNRHISARQKQKLLLRRMIFVLCCAVVFLLLCTIVRTVYANSKPVTVMLKLDKAEIIQGEALPAFKASAVYQGEKKEKAAERVLDKKSQTTLQDFLNQLNSGKGYTFTCKADTSIDNTYPVTITLNKSLKSKLKGIWQKKVNLIVTDGELIVKNPLGTWEGSKFKLNDGSYLTSDYLVSRGKTYYFDNNGEKVVGEQRIGLKTCTFSKDGVLESKKDAVIEPDKPMVALTFDDGPGERTSELLDILDKYNARATFFMMGKSAVNYSDTIKKMDELGNELGNHSYNHPQLPKLSADEIKKQINDTNAAIKAACGKPADVMRPPYGAITSKVSENVGMPMILWTIDTLDWKTKDAQATYDSVISSASDGAIMLMHDIHSTTVDAAARIIPELTRQGYQLVTISELAKAKGITLENGKSYREEL